MPAATAAATPSAARLPLNESGAMTTRTSSSMPGRVVRFGPVTPAITDFYAIEDLLEPEEIEIRDRVRAFCEAEVIPRINDYWERADFPFELVPKMAELGIAGGTIEGYGCPGMSAVSAGLVAAELARADGSVGTFNGVHSFLAMQSIALLGSEEQRERWLRGMAGLEKIGAFGLPEPKHGSDAVGLEPSARRDGEAYVLDGQKKWIGNGSIADHVLIWARGEDGAVGGDVVDKGTPGYSARGMTGKTALRAGWQGRDPPHGGRGAGGEKPAERPPVQGGSQGP